MIRLILAAFLSLVGIVGAFAQAPNQGMTPSNPPGLPLGGGTLTGSPATIQLQPSSTGQSTVNGGNGGTIFENIVTDYTTWTGTALRPNYFLSSLAPSTTTTNVWENFTSAVTLSSGTANGEINTFHGQFTNSSGATSAQVENYEARYDNSGSINNFVHYLANGNNLSAGTITGVEYGMQCLPKNANVTAATIATFACLDMEPLAGGGSNPTFYYLIRNNEPNASINTVGNIAIGTLTPKTNLLYVQGPDTSNSTLIVQTANSSVASVFSVADGGNVNVPIGPLNVGTAGSQWGKVALANTTSGTLFLVAPSSGALGSSIATFPINSGTVAELNLAQAFSANQTFSAAILNTGITSDVTHTDASVCEDTTTHQFYSGSGTLGVCLGTSSARYKHDIVALDAGLNEIMKLEPVAYHLNEDHGDPNKLFYGFTAEQGEKALPALTGEDTSGKPNTFDYLGVVPVLVKGMQQLKAENDNLRVCNDNWKCRLFGIK